MLNAMNRLFLPTKARLVTGLIRHRLRPAGDQRRRLNPRDRAVGQELLALELRLDPGRGRAGRISAETIAAWAGSLMGRQLELFEPLS